MVKGVKGNLKSAVERFNNQSNRKSVATSLRKSGKVKSTKHIVAIDPITKQLVSGNITQIAKQLKTSTRKASQVSNWSWMTSSYSLSWCQHHLTFCTPVL